MLVGRDRELEALSGLLARARAGAGGAIVVRGEPGIGKTALLDELVSARGEMRLLRTQGVEAESPLAFAALHRLLLPVLGRRSELPEPQARALARVFGAGADDATDDRFLVFLAALTLLTGTEDDTPLLCVVDDAHWLDEPSLATLLFVARRVDFAPLALVFAVRDGESRSVDAPDLPTLTLPGLDQGAADELLRQTDPALPAQVRADLVRRTAGNPLALLELPKALGGPAARTDLPWQLPLTENLERVFAGRASRLSPDGQRLLLVIALDDSGSAAVAASAATHLGLTDFVLDEVVGSGLVENRDGQFRFRHPLVRSAVHATATPGELRNVHRALSAALDTHHEPDRAIWHLAATTDVPDEATAARLERAASRFQQRGGHEAASAAFERAGQLSTEIGAAGPRLARAAVAAWLAGDPLRTRALAQRARALLDDPPAVADLDRLRAFVEMNFGSPRLAHGILAGAATVAEEAGDLSRARQFAMVATALATFEADSGAPVAVHRLANPDALDPLEACFSSLLLGLDGMARERVEEAAPLLLRAIEVADEVQAPDLLTNIGIATLLLGADELALRWHDRQLDAARAQASLLGVIHALTRRAIEQLAMGRWAELTAACTEVLDLARATGHDNQRALPMAQLLVVDACRGADDVPARADDIERLVRDFPSGVLEDLSLDTLRWARGIHAARSAPASALLHFEGLRLPLLRRAAALDTAEAAARAGDRETGRRAAAELRRFAAATGNEWAAAYAAHATALTANEADRERLLAEAMAHHRAAARPFARARTELALGEHLRRHRRRVDAREHLRAALARFEDLGASPWADRAAEELRASGETSRRRNSLPADAPATLTAQELQVAHLVQDGLANKEVAARLFLSPRTVEFHLRNIFGKLEISSRASLAKLELPGTG